MSRWYLELLGPVIVHDQHSGVTHTRFRTTRGMCLLGYLGRRPSMLYSRERVAEALWPDGDPARQRPRLRYELSTLTATLDPIFFRKDSNGQLGLSPEVTSDLGNFYHAVETTPQLIETTTRLGVLRIAVDAVLNRPDFLEGFYDDWVLTERELFEDTLYQTLRRLVRELAQNGQRSDAEQYVAASRQRFPDRPPLPLPAPLAPPYPPSGSVSTRWIGRTTELATLQSWRTETAQRLLTLTGPGGMGKTRLALQAFPDALFIGLAELRQAEELWSVLLASLEVSPSEVLTPQEQALAALREQDIPFVLLDNAEHLQPNLDALIGELLRATSATTRFIVTSRSALHLPEERLVRLQGLPLPDARALFCDRARTLRSNFIPTPDVDSVCELLEGIPLAIELAAARTLLLGNQQILEQLRLSLLKNRRAHPGDRHRSLHATIEWSVSLLPPELRALFERLAVFRGGFTLEAAEQCFQAEIHDLEDLYESSLLECSPQTENRRYRLLTVIREFAEEILTESNLAHAQQCHANYFQEQAKIAHQHELSGHWDTASTLILGEQDNLRATQEYYLLTKNVSALVAFTEAIFQLYFELGLWHELEILLHRCEEILADGRDVRLQARCYGWRASLLRRQGKNEEAWPYWEKRLTIFDNLKDEYQVLHTIWEMMGQAIDTNDITRANYLESRINQIDSAHFEAHGKDNEFLIRSIFRLVLQARKSHATDLQDKSYHLSLESLKILENEELHNHKNYHQALRYTNYYCIPIIQKSSLDTSINLSIHFIRYCHLNKQIFLAGHILYSLHLALKLRNFHFESLKCLYISLLIHKRLASRMYSQMALTFTNIMIDYPDDVTVTMWLQHVGSLAHSWELLYLEIEPILCFLERQDKVNNHGEFSRYQQPSTR